MLERYASRAMKDVLLRHIKTDIYDVYEPKKDGWISYSGEPTTYRRQHVLENSVHTVWEDGGLLVTSGAVPARPVIAGYTFENRQDGSFLELLESGHMGLWHGGFPRPAVRGTQEELDEQMKQESGAVADAVRRGIAAVIEGE